MSKEIIDSKPKEIVEPLIMDKADCWIRDGNSYVKKEYKFIQPVFGKSNTDQSYYEPRASSIANLFKSAGNADKTPLYDFTDELPKNGKEIDVVKASHVLKSEHDKGRKIAALRGNKGADISEISQLEREAYQELEDTLADQKREVEQMDKEMRFVDLAKQRLDNTTQSTSENV